MGPERHAFCDIEFEILNFGIWNIPEIEFVIRNL